MAQEAWEVIAVELCIADGNDPYHLLWENNEPWGEVYHNYRRKAEEILEERQLERNKNA